MSCQFPEWIEDSLIVGLSASRTFDPEGNCQKQTVDLTNLNEVVKLTKKEEVDTFSSQIIHGQMKTLLLGNNMHVMTQSLKEGDEPHLPHGLSVVNTYANVISGSMWVAVVVETWWLPWSLLPRVLKLPKW